jgi:hypothetical protein
MKRTCVRSPGRFQITNIGDREQIGFTADSITPALLQDVR